MAKTEKNPSPEAGTYALAPEAERRDPASVLNAEQPASERDTAVAAGETAEPGKKESPTKVFNALAEERNAIQRELNAEDLSPQAKEVWLEQKKNKSLEILEKTWEAMGRDPKVEMEKLEAAKEKQWDIAVAAMGKKTGMDYGAWNRKVFENQELPKIYEQTVAVDPHLSREQKEYLATHPNGSLSVGKWFGQILLSREDVALCSSMGIDPNDVSFGAFGFSKKIVAGGRTFKDIADFNQELAREKNRIVTKNMKGKEDQAKGKIVDGEITQYVLDQAVSSLAGELRNVQKEKRKASREKRAKDLAEGAGKITEDERRKLLEEFKEKWDSATANHRDIKENFFLLLEAEEEEKMAKERSLEFRNGKSSTDIIGIAEKLSGRDLQKEATEKTGYSPGESISDVDEQQAFRKYLTDESRKIYQEQISKLHDEEARRGFSEILDELKNESEIAISSVDDSGLPKKAKSGLQPLKFRGFSEQDMGVKFSTELTDKMLSSLSGKISNDSEKLSRFFANKFGETVSPEIIEKTIASEKYQEAVRSKNDLAGLLTDFFMDRPWDEGKEAAGVEKDLIGKLARPNPKIKAIEKRIARATKDVTTPRVRSNGTKRRIKPVGTTGGPAEEPQQDLPAPRANPVPVDRPAAEPAINPDLRPPQEFPRDKAAREKVLGQKEGLDALRPLVTGDINQDAFTLATFFQQRLGETVNAKQIKEFTSPERYKKDVEDGNLTEWITRVLSDKPWEPRKRRNRKR